MRPRRKAGPTVVFKKLRVTSPTKGLGSTDSKGDGVVVGFNKGLPSIWGRIRNSLSKSPEFGPI